ncbi:MAG: SIS domain-containing protein [Planctomycetaceae bacterium]|jgi:D-sedoheptulose 7-phosphate isomerase|nr:SIS domain-containing protein [Planctomycetaceae bacterium]
MKTKVKTYHEMFTGLLSGIDFEGLSKAASLVSKTYLADKQIFTAGNGGSAALAIHFAAEFGKSVTAGNDKPPRILSLCCNTAAITALGNDYGYDHIFSYQLRGLLNSGDLVILISPSGHSPNIIKAAEFAQSAGASILGMTGFNGGKLKELSDVALHVPCNVNELIGDVHSFFCSAIIYACNRKVS